MTMTLTPSRAAAVLKLHPENWTREARDALAALAAGRVIAVPAAELAALAIRGDNGAPPLKLWHVRCVADSPAQGAGAQRPVLDFTTFAETAGLALQQVRQTGVLAGRTVLAIHAQADSNPRRVRLSSTEEFVDADRIAALADEGRASVEGAEAMIRALAGAAE